MLKSLFAILFFLKPDLLSSRKVCLELKCNISLADRLYRRTALHIAAESNPEMIPLLLEAGFEGWEIPGSAI